MKRKIQGILKIMEEILFTLNALIDHNDSVVTFLVQLQIKLQTTLFLKQNKKNLEFS